MFDVRRTETELGQQTITRVTKSTVMADTVIIIIIIIIIIIKTTTYVNLTCDVLILRQTSFTCFFSLFRILMLSVVDPYAIRRGSLCYPSWILMLSVVDPYAIRRGSLCYPPWILMLSVVDPYAIRRESLCYPSWIHIWNTSVYEREA